MIRQRALLLASVGLLASLPSAMAGGGGHGFGGHASYWGGSYGAIGGVGGYSGSGYGLGGYGLGGRGYGWGGYGSGWGGYSYGWGGHGYLWGSYPSTGLGLGYAPYGAWGFGAYYSSALNSSNIHAVTPAPTDSAAHLDVSVPADATVWFNGARMVEEKGTNRHFKSPALEDGKNYAYEIKAQWMEDGKPIEKTQTIVVRANQHLSVSLDSSAAPAASVAGNAARIQVALPAAEAKVWLNDAPTESTGFNRRFLSPPLEPGQNYSYKLRAQWLEAGRTVERTAKVLVQAGKQVNVDLTKAAENGASVAATK